MQCHAPVTPSYTEAELRGIMVPGQPEQKQFKRPYLNGKKVEHGDVCLSSQQLQGV
jgi:hypothetical protein